MFEFFEDQIVGILIGVSAAFLLLCMIGCFISPSSNSDALYWYKKYGEEVCSHRNSTLAEIMVTGGGSGHVWMCQDNTTKVLSRVE